MKSKLIVWATLIAVIFLIFIGGVVRSTGAGLGCPDWPKCFGKWIPPTNESQLPSNYKKIYQHSNGEEAVFNPIKTWTEYINRLLGISIGLLIIATFAATLSLRKTKSYLVWMSGANVILVIVQGGLGAMVVKSSLTPELVSLHMILALLIVAILVSSLVDIYDIKPTAISSNTHVLLWICTLTIGVQIMLGIQVREQVDLLLNANHLSRAHWIGTLHWNFYVHRSFSLLITALHGWLWWKLPKNKPISHLSNAMMACLLGLIGLGIVMTYMDMPVLAQPLHLLLSSILFAIEMALIQTLRKK